MTASSRRFQRASYVNRVFSVARELSMWATSYRDMTEPAQAWRFDARQLETAVWRAGALDELAQELARIAARIDNLR